MAEATLVHGGRPIEPWTVHCSHCGTAVSVSGGEGVSTCGACGRQVEAAVAETAAGRPPAPPADVNDSLVGTRLGPWRLERLLGRGGMGRVYEAREAEGGRRVALKVLGDALAGDAGFVRRFQREAKVLATLSHPHVVEVLDQGETDGRLWFAMEYVRGENLRRRIERGALPPAEAARISGEIASALAYAHERGVIHRDLKPENVLLSEDGRARLADFGLLRLARETSPETTTRLTRTDVILGTYEYMAPEQRRGTAEVDARADVFALGVILYECLTGRLPLGRFPPASDLVRGLPRAVDTVVNRALAPEPRERFESARAFADGLRGAMAGAPAAPAPATAPVGVPAPVAPAPGATEAEADLRRLGHVRLIATFDRVVGWLLLIACTVPAVAAGILAPVGITLVPFVLLLVIGGVLMLKLGKRLRNLEPGSREGQIVASALLCLFFPLGTALGLYGLIIMAPYRTLRAMERARGSSRRTWSQSPPAYRGYVPTPPPPLPPVPAPVGPIERVEVLGEEARRGPGALLRILAFAAVIWTLYLGFYGTRAVRMQDMQVEAHRVGVDAQRPPGTDTAVGPGHGSSPSAAAISWTACGAIFAGVLAFLRWPQRRERRGVGLALTSFALLAADLGFLILVASRAAQPSLWT
jgi:predicted Ser/Thr protein kinase